MVQQDSSISEETAASSYELSNQAKQLDAIISQFKISRQLVQEIQQYPESQPITKLEPAPEDLDKPPANVELPLPTQNKVITLDDESFGNIDW